MDLKVNINEKKSKNIFVLFTIVFTINVICVSNKSVKGESTKVNIYIKNSKDLKSKKRQKLISSTKSDGQKINNFVKNSSKTQSRKSKRNIVTDRMKESGIATKNMVKDNKWFVKEPFHKSYNKISTIKRIVPSKFVNVEDKEVSVKASKLSKIRARNTGYIKPEEVFSKDSSRKAKLISSSQTVSSGPVKAGPVYSENSSRLASDISNKRARATGPIKPEIIYSDQIGRKAFEMSLKNKKIKKNKKNIEINYSDQRYSVDFLRSLSRKNIIKENL